VKRDLREALATALAGLLVVGLIAGSILIWTSAPCGLWKFAKAGETPARCLVHR
jgi:hypothetical protein